MRALMQQAHAARQAGQSSDQVKALVARGQGNREHMWQASQTLQQQVNGVLTADQRAWLAANPPVVCHGARPQLTAAQRAQLKASRQRLAQTNPSERVASPSSSTACVRHVRAGSRAG